MSADRLGLRGEEYAKLSMKSLYESQLLESILQNQDVLFPGYACGRFAPLLTSPWGDVRPDLALVDVVNYQKWWLVEVEMSHHSLYWHVAEQIEKLGRSQIDEKVIVSLSAAIPNADHQRLKKLVESTPPSLLCIADRIPDEWRHAVPRDLVTWMEVTAYRSQTGAIALRSQNQVAIRSTVRTGKFTYIRGLPSVFRLHLDEPIAKANPIQIEYRGVTGLWVVDQETRLVSPIGTIELPGKTNFELLRSGNLYRIEAMKEEAQ